MAVLWILYLIDWGFRNPKIISAITSGKKGILIVAATFIAVIFFTTKSNMLQDISAWFGKDITFNGRTGIWAIAVDYIVKHPVIGMGPVLIFDMGWGVNMTHAHCLYLNIMAHNGIFALLLIGVIVWSSLKKPDVKLSQAYCSLFLYLIGSIVEVYSLNSLLLFCVVLGCYNSNRRNN